MDEKFVRLMKSAGPVFYSVFNRIFGFPFFYQIEITTQCNLRCLMCEAAYSPEKGQNINFNGFRKIFESIWGCHSIFIRRFLAKLILFDLTGLGEALMNKDFLDIVEFLKSKGVSVMFADNFVLFNDDVAGRLVNARIDLIYISLDGATKEVLEKIRLGANFETIVSNIKNLVKIKKDMKSQKPVLVIRNLVSALNIEEMPLLVELAAEMGIRGVDFTFPNSGVMKTHHKEEPFRVDLQKYTVFKEKAQKVAAEHNINLSFASAQRLPMEKCKRPFSSMFITAKGYILPCCFINQQGNYSDVLQEVNFGNVFTQDIKDIWFSERCRNFRNLMKEKKTPAMCRNCYIYTPFEKEGEL